MRVACICSLAAGDGNAGCHCGAARGPRAKITAGVTPGRPRPSQDAKETVRARGGSRAVPARGAVPWGAVNVRGGIATKTKLCCALVAKYDTFASVV